MDRNGGRRWKMGKKQSVPRGGGRGARAQKLAVHSAVYGPTSERSLNGFSMVESGSKRVETF